MDCSMPGFPVQHQLLELAQTHVHRVPSNRLILCRPLLLLPSIFPSISLFKWVSFLQKNVLGVVTGSSVKPVDPKGNQSWIFIGRTDDEAEAPILWPPDAKSWLIRKDSDAGKDWGQEEKWVAEDEMVGWHHQLNGHEFEQALGDGEGQGSLAYCSPWGCKELDMTEQLNWKNTFKFVSWIFNQKFHKDFSLLCKCVKGCRCGRICLQCSTRKWVYAK